MFKEKYYELIDKAKLQNTDDNIVYEIHHIIPRSLGGTDDKSNLVKLTPEEHYDAHYYLWKFTNTPQMAWAFWLFNNFKGRKISREEYGELRRQAAKASAELQKKPVYCLELDKVFPSMQEAAIAVGARKDHSSYIGEVCNKKHKACFEWKNGLRYHWCWPKDIEEFKKHKEELLYEEAHRKELTIKKISEARKGKAVHSKTVTCVETGQKFNNLKEAAIFCDGYSSNIKYSAEQGTPYHGYHWKLDGVEVELKEKVSHWKGKHLSEEMKKKMVVSKSNVLKIKCIELDKIFDSARAAAVWLGISPSAGSYVKEKALKKEEYRGYHWEIIEKEKQKIRCIELNKIFDNARAAADYLHRSSGSYILEGIRKNLPCYGYHWEFVD